ncbi:hypothetical protein ABN028_19330 [Actinopolymorpha sp. B17G11]|uniref:hypothetical protein n=1 Tax=Actinopolymorpha sp. B17G11 TaxID=3160861 RepID=UPI0032E3D822
MGEHEPTEPEGWTRPGNADEIRAREYADSGDWPAAQTFASLHLGGLLQRVLFAMTNPPEDEDDLDEGDEGDPDVRYADYLTGEKAQPEDAEEEPPPNFVDDRHTIIVVDEVEIEGREGNPNELGVACWTVKAPGAGSATRGGGDRAWRHEKKAPKLPKRLYVIEHPADCPFPVCPVEYFVDAHGAHDAVEGLAELRQGRYRLLHEEYRDDTGGWERLTIQQAVDGGER